LDDLGCEREKGHERGLREIHQLDPVWTLGSFWTLECKAKSLKNEKKTRGKLQFFIFWEIAIFLVFFHFFHFFIIFASSGGIDEK
jgi:hypothetical protein